MITAARKRPLCALCLLLMLLILLAKLVGLEIFGKPPDDPVLDACVESGASVQIVGTITDRIEKTRSVQYILSNSYLQSEKQSIPLYTISVIATEERNLAAGSVLLVRGTIARPDKATNPGQFDQRLYYNSQRIYYSVFLQSCKVLRESSSFKEKLLRIRDMLLMRVEDTAGTEAEPVLKAMLLGDRSDLSGDLKRSYQVGGILHILAISGMHIALLGQGILKLFQKLRLPFLPAAILTFLFLILYCILTGAAASSVRAVCMFGVLLGARLLLRTYDSLTSLALAGILVLLENPGFLFASGFQLSFCAILAVSVFWPSFAWLLPGQVRKPTKLQGRRGLIKEEKRELRRKTGRNWAFYYFRLFLRYGLFWLTINVIMLPLTTYYYYEFPVWGLLPNLLLLPVMPLLLGVGTTGILAGCWNLRLGRLILYPVEIVLKQMHRLTDLLRSLPFSTVVCGKPEIWQLLMAFLLLGVLSWWLLQGKRIAGKTKQKNRKQIIRKYRKFAALGIGCFLGIVLIRLEPVWSVTMLDVGQGDCLVLKNRNSVFLVDGGSSNVKEVGQYRILPYLKSQGIAHIDGIFLTHPDEDHSNGLREVFRAIQKKEVTLSVDSLYLPLWMEGSEEEQEWILASASVGANVCYLARGDRLRAGLTEIEVLNPYSAGGIQSGNSGSLVLSVRNGTFDALLTGDLESDGENMLLPLEHTYEYLKTAHHGSKGSSSEVFLKEVCPCVAVISAPENSPYGHPNKETLERLQAAGAEIYTTRDCGAIRVEGNKKDWRLRGFLSEKQTLPEG